MLRITGFPTTPGPTEPALTTDKNFINADVVMICRLKERITKLNEISSKRLFSAWHKICKEGFSRQSFLEPENKREDEQANLNLVVYRQIGSLWPLGTFSCLSCLRKLWLSRFFKVIIVSSCWVQVKNVDKFFNTCPVKLVILIFAYIFIVKLQQAYLAGWLFLRGLERDFSWVWIPKLKTSFTLGDRETHSSSSHSPGVSFSLYLDATKWRTGLEVKKYTCGFKHRRCPNSRNSPTGMTHPMRLIPFH